MPNEGSSRSGAAFTREFHTARVPYGMLAVWFLGQESLIVKGGHTVLAIDPFVSDEVEKVHGIRRLYPPPFGPEHMDRLDYCLISHEHADHLDPGTIRVLAERCPQTVYMAPACCRSRLLELGVPAGQLMDAATDAWLNLKDGLDIMPIPSAHERLEQDDGGFHRYVGYIIRLNGVTMYHAGDTVVYDGLTERLSKAEIDLGFLPINGRDYYRQLRGIVGNMDCREAAELAAASRFDTVVPLHYDLFAGNIERPGAFADELQNRYPEQKFHIMARYERYLYAASCPFMDQSDHGSSVPSG